MKKVRRLWNVGIDCNIYSGFDILNFYKEKQIKLSNSVEFVTYYNKIDKKRNTYIFSFEERFLEDYEYNVGYYDEEN